MTDTVAMLPPSSAGCLGAVVDGPGKIVGRVNVLCRSCLRYLSREHADWIMPTPQIARGDGTYYCFKRIGS